MPVCNKQEKENYKSLNEKKSNVKCVVVGDAMVGKTSLARRLACLGFATDYNPTTFDNYAVTTSMNGKSYVISLFDTAGQEEYIHLRALSYVNSDVFLLCFSVATSESLVDAQDKWITEIRQYCPHTPIILVGTQIDLRDEAPPPPPPPQPSLISSSRTSLPGKSTRPNQTQSSSNSNKQSASGAAKAPGSRRTSTTNTKLPPVFITTKEGVNAAAKINADCYVECSSLTEAGISRLREAAIESGCKKVDIEDSGCNCACSIM